MTCGVTRAHLNSHNQRLAGLSSSPPTRNGYVDCAACSPWDALPSMTACGRTRRRLQGLPRVTCAVDEHERRSRGGGDDPVVRDPEVPRTDLLLTASMHGAPSTAPAKTD